MAGSANAKIELRWDTYFRELVCKRLTWRELGDELEWRRTPAGERSGTTFEERAALQVGRQLDMAWPESRVSPESLRGEKTADDYRRLRAMTKPSSGFPRPGLAFEIGQAVRPFLPYSSGPVGLWASGHHRHLIGFLATWWCEISESGQRQSDVALFHRLARLPQLLENTVFDYLPFLAETYALMEQLDDEEAFAKFTAGMEPVVSPAKELFHHVREKARVELVFTEQQLLHFDQVWQHWLGAEQVTREWPIELRIAYACCGPSFSAVEREGVFVTAVCIGFMDRIRARSGAVKGL